MLAISGLWSKDRRKNNHLEEIKLEKDRVKSLGVGWKEKQSGCQNLSLRIDSHGQGEVGAGYRVDKAMGSVKKQGPTSSHLRVTGSTSQAMNEVG